MTIPQVSVVMAVFNGERFVDDAIESIVQQTFKDLELIIVDDGSTDGTPAILQDWAQRDSRIRVLAQENSGRPAVARNRGLELARGSFVTFLDGDDLFHPDKLAVQVQVFNEFPLVGVVFHDFRWFPSGTQPEGVEPRLRSSGFLDRARKVLVQQPSLDGNLYLGTADLIKFMSIDTIGMHTSSVAVRREVLSERTPPGFREDLPSAEDIDLWLRLARVTPVAYIDLPLSHYRFHSESWMSLTSLRALAHGSFLVKGQMLTRVREILTQDEWQINRPRIASYWSDLGYQCFVAGLTREARTCYACSLKTLPSLRVLKRAGVSFLPRQLVLAYWRRTGGGETTLRPRPDTC
jgi:glycosyltransferase involved in cell wall biosynthesis